MAAELDDNIPNIYDLTNFKPKNRYHLKFIFSLKSFFKDGSFKEIYINNELIDKKYYIGNLNQIYCFNITTFLHKIKDKTNIYNKLTSDKAFSIYIRTNLKHFIRLATGYDTFVIIDKLFASNVYSTYLNLEFIPNFFKEHDVLINDDDIFINLYLTEDNFVRQKYVYTYTWCVEDIHNGTTTPLNQRNEYPIKFKFWLNKQIELKVSTNKIKSYTIETSLKNCLLVLDLYFSNSRQVNLYVSKIINTDTNEVITLLPVKKCGKCKIVPDNIQTSELYNKELICEHIAEIIRNNIKDSFNLGKKIIEIKITKIYDIFKALDKTLTKNDRGIQLIYRAV